MIMLDITQDILNEVNIYVNSYLVDCMVNKKMSESAITCILQTLTDAIDEAQDKLDNDEN